jgi:hypothetical protein
MRRLLLAVAVLSFAGLPAPADEVLKTPSLKPLEEVWEAAYVQNDAGVNVKIGHIHLTSKAMEQDGKPFIRSTKELRFVLGRAGQSASMQADMTTDEDANGKVLGIKARIGLGKDRDQNLDCTVNGEKITVVAAGEFKFTKEFRWDPACLGLVGEQTLLRQKKAKTGDKFTYRYFEPQVSNYVTIRGEVKEKETVALPGSGRRELLKVTQKPDALKINETQQLQLPAATFWVDPVSYETMKTEMDIAEIGKVTLLRTSKVAALAENGQVPDLMKRQSIFLPHAIPDMHERDSMVYKITFSGDALPKELVREDARQSIKNISGKTFELHVQSVRKPVRLAKEEKADAEFLRSNYFINSDDSEVKKLAARAVGTEPDAWKKAQKIESCVRGFMKPADYTEAMAPADHVARTRTGDCTEYSMLAAAMCRAVGVPSRTAIGLVYVNNLLGKPGLAFHMWTEVFVNGQWLGIDATLGEGSIGPGHIKITDHSWDGVVSFTPLLPVKGFIMASPKVEVGK